MSSGHKRMSHPPKSLHDKAAGDHPVELNLLNPSHQDDPAPIHHYTIDPLDYSDGDEDEDLYSYDEHQALTGHHAGKESPHSSHLLPGSAHHPTDTSGLRSHRDDDTDTIDVNIIPLSSSEAIDRQRGDLQKNVTFSNGLTLVIGTIIGSGTFASPGPVLAYSKSVGVSLIIWFVSGLLAFAGSLCYAELGSAMPNSGGGEHAYLNHAFGSLPAFLFSWTSISL
ncbi:b(0,+)-type amino acid transporter 1 [Lunasporangiospora selenospora]|uniref:B(0,+)-type amino acid transporter 1 n=1 Tax=Lunasporangiospora selenospora TaxID=979761 RepID=A0A9P6KCB4_9FUNG|nr:b(0,+)-type amino acid transporter 1 [Lunasporangiospora selenospora]